MKIIKHISAIVFALFISTAVFAGGNNLWEHFRGRLSSIEERALVYREIGEEEYRGTVEQNTKLHLYFDKSVPLGALAFPPSTVEGTSTAGWTDDGSIVRLNTSGDSVGIGTANPAEKLTVSGGNLSVSGSGVFGSTLTALGDISTQGGDLNIGTGSATSTLTSASGRLGVGTTSPAAAFSVNGSSYITGTSSMAALVVASSTISLRGVEYTAPSAGGSANQVLTTSATNVLSWQTSSASDVPELGSISASSSVSGINLTFATSTDLRVVVTLVGESSQSATSIRFNGDVGENYTVKTWLNFGLNNNSASSAPFAIFLGTSTPFSKYSTLDIQNENDNNKNFHFTSSQPDSSGISMFTGVGEWRNSTTTITRISLFKASGTFGSSTRMTVFGRTRTQ